MILSFPSLPFESLATYFFSIPVFTNLSLPLTLTLLAPPPLFFLKQTLSLILSVLLPLSLFLHVSESPSVLGGCVRAGGEQRVVREHGPAHRAQSQGQYVLCYTTVLRFKSS